MINNTYDLPLMYIMYGNVLDNSNSYTHISSYMVLYDQESIPHVMNPSYIIYLSYGLYCIDFVSLCFIL